MAVVKDPTLCYVHIQNYPAPKKPANMQSEAIERRIYLLKYLANLAILKSRSQPLDFTFLKSIAKERHIF